MTEKNISSRNQDVIRRLADDYLRSDLAIREIQPTMWISAIDFTHKLNLDKLKEFATAQFYDTFEWSELLTTSTTATKAADAKQGSGRKNTRRQ